MCGLVCIRRQFPLPGPAPRCSHHFCRYSEGTGDNSRMEVATRGFHGFTISGFKFCALNALATTTTWSFPTTKWKAASVPCTSPKEIPGSPLPMGQSPISSWKTSSSAIHSLPPWTATPGLRTYLTMRRLETSRALARGVNLPSGGLVVCLSVLGRPPTRKRRV